jgi:hypothetical protein
LISALVDRMTREAYRDLVCQERECDDSQCAKGGVVGRHVDDVRVVEEMFY